MHTCGITYCTYMLAAISHKKPLTDDLFSPSHVIFVLDSVPSSSSSPCSSRFDPLCTSIPVEREKINLVQHFTTPLALNKFLWRNMTLGFGTGILTLNGWQMENGGKRAPWQTDPIRLLHLTLGNNLLRFQQCPDVWVPKMGGACGGSMQRRWNKSLYSARRLTFQRSFTSLSGAAA